MALIDLLKNLPEVTPPIEKKVSFNVKLKWTLIILIAFFILSIDTSTPEGKKYFQGLQKLLTFAFVIFESMVYVLMNGVEAAPGFTGLVILQLCLGGFLIVFTDEVIQKWGFGSGVSLFIAVVFAQSLKVEIPLAFDRIRGYSIRWPLQFFYAGVMPVIFVSALVANIQLFGSLIQGWVGHPTFLGGFSGAAPVSGLAYWIGTTNIIEALITGSFRWIYALQALIHVLFYVILAVLFSFFWVNTAGMDARSQAGKIMNSGMSMPGFRKDERVMESILKRYINPLTIMGGAAIGLLASVANLLGALVGGTAILLAIMVIYQLY